MKPRALKHLSHSREAADAILEYAAGQTLDDYRGKRILRSAIEREFLIIGESLVRLRRDDPATLALLTKAPSIIAFRNILVHAYDGIDDSNVWNIVECHLPVLRAEIDLLLTASGNSSPAEEE